MNETLNDIDNLETVARGIRLGISNNFLLELVEKMIEAKQLEVRMFENQMEIEHGTNCS